jgi:hypothetical protein
MIQSRETLLFALNYNNVYKEVYSLIILSGDS